MSMEFEVSLSEARRLVNAAGLDSRLGSIDYWGPDGSAKISSDGWCVKATSGDVCLKFHRNNLYGGCLCVDVIVGGGKIETVNMISLDKNAADKVFDTFRELRSDSEFSVLMEVCCGASPCQTKSL